ncbi:deoxynucleotidyltransferase terminal-interacting protein 2 [Dermacentor andersoni]|uniref:deoxynucleotidyltransferase terminal-interacting protein 2 n=1 Tax=Dermacentor andersoni TaxID=34620 RepID=UPI0021550B95|nr:deoxynucleotidyltransferase terminal-interacting protein 2-like [Dermacentor andersoni]
MSKTESRVPSSLQSKYLQKFDGLTLSKSESDDSDEDDGEPRGITFFVDSKPRVEPETEEAPCKTTEKVKLASELNPGINLGDTYVAARDAASKSAQKIRELVLESSADCLLKGSVLTPGFEKKDCVPPYSESMRRIKLRRKEERSKTKGPGWFGLPAPEMTDELKHDLEVLRMRHVLDPKRFYKKNDLKDLPKYFQVGTVMDSPADFYHARVPKKDRKQTMVEELLADAEFRRFNKKKYSEAMARQQRAVSKKALMHMKRLKKRKK